MNQRHSRTGSLSLEAALTLPWLLALGLCLLSAIQCIETEIKLKAALDRTAAEISLLSPAVNLAADLINSTGISDQVKPGERTEAEDLLNGVLNELFPGESIDGIVNDLLLDFTSTALIGPLIQKRMDFWLAEGWSGQPGWQNRVGERRLFLDWQGDKPVLWLCLAYELKTPAGVFKKQANAVVPLWFKNPKTTADTESSEIWMLDNFTRGHRFRKIYGANLPDYFPVIASFRDGEATMIKSIDLTAPTYQDKNVLRSCIETMIDDLAGFTGAGSPGREEKVVITVDEIKRRRLLVIIPENAGQPWLTDLEHELQQYAFSRHVTLRFVRYARSTRYEKADNFPEIA